MTIKLRYAIIFVGSSSTVPGGVSERFKVTVLKTVGPARVPWVRIPPPPPALLARFDTWRVGRVGRRRSPAKRVYWLKPVSRVRIPCSPPSFSFRRSIYALVAQLDRVSGYEPEGRRFESARAHHNKRESLGTLFCYGELNHRTRRVRPRLAAKRLILRAQVLPIKGLERARVESARIRLSRKTSQQKHPATMK